MKFFHKTRALILLTALTLLTAAACAAPAVTDGEITAWIGEGGRLFIQGADGANRQKLLTVTDLPRVTEEEILCVTGEGKILALRKDETGSREITGDAETVLPDPRVILNNGILSLDTVVVSESAAAAVQDGSFLYYAEKTDAGWFLRVRSLSAGVRTVPVGSRDAFAYGLADRAIDEPLSITVTREALTLTGADHRLTIYQLLTGESAVYPAVSENTAAACVVNGMLYRYVQTEDQTWVLETSQAIVTPTPSPTPAATPTPTAAPKSTAATIGEDGTIYKGAAGSQVRKIQRRLAELGYPVGNVDGSYGEQTQLAINLFCDAIGVREHNYITKKVQNRLFADTAPAYDPFLPLKKGDRGVSVLYMQMRLKELGYDPGKLDGIYGDLTAAAVAKFQDDYGIARELNEKPGEVASREMMEILFAPEPTATTTPATQTDLH